MAARWSVWLTLALVGCSPVGQPPAPVPEPYTALYRVTAGPVPLYEQAQDGMRPVEEPRLHTGCIFDVQRTDAAHEWAYGRVFRCADVPATGVVEPQMGIRPKESRVYDGSVGYFPMRFLDPYTGSPPAPRK